MPGVARIGDIAVGTCCCHSDPTCVPYTGIIASGAGTITAEGSQVAKIGDITVGCHVGIIATGSPTVLAEGSNISSIGDSVVGCPSATIVTGAGTVYV